MSRQDPASPSVRPAQPGVDVIIETKTADPANHSVGPTKQSALGDPLPVRINPNPERRRIEAISAPPPPPDVPESRELAPGEVVGRYVVLSLLGAGGMGSVYAARDPELDRKVALKLLHLRSGQARLLREAKTLAKLTHPNVVTAHDVGVYEGRVFLAMEYVDGSTLRHWVTVKKRTWREILGVFIHAARGLAAAHASGIVHRDFKPDNVILGRDGRVCVLDFGLAGEPGTWPPEDAGDGARRSSFPPRGVAGTPAYMAPEQHLALTSDARTDQFSFCVTLWEALFGNRPFHVSTLAALSSHNVRPAVPAPSDVPDWLVRIMLRGLSLDATSRHASMDALMAEIDAGLRASEARARIVGRRYELLSQLTGVLPNAHRALDKLTGSIVTLVRIDASQGEGTDSKERVMHLRRFEPLTSLHHPHLMGVLDCGFDDEQRPFLVLDLREHAEELPAATRHKPVSLKINLLVQLLRALSFLHRRGMMHGALDASHALVVGGQLKLLTVGTRFASQRDRDPVTQKSGMRPAATALGDGFARASVDADLRALGMLALELFAKSPSSDRSRSSRGGGADSASLEVDRRVAQVFDRLVTPAAAPPMRTASEVITALSTALGRALPIETEETRESFLQAAVFVGREAELSKLRGALRESVQGRGSAWLVGGESGVGKSRLLDELRTFARVQGALVLRGQEESEGGSPYRLWRDALRWLALVTDLEQLEASVLLPAVPDLTSLLGRAVPAAPDLDGASMHSRLLEVVLRILERQTQPLVLLLEDLQWARSDSIKLLQTIATRVCDLPILIVATYRSDERPELPAELPMMTSLPLARFEPDVIAALSVSMIGAAGERPELLALLRRETEGNAFFLVEVVRALAEEAGSLDRVGIGSLPLPESVFVGGMRRVVQRRLERVAEHDRPLLRAAAVIGRRIDLQLLAELAPNEDQDAWARGCIEAAVIERQDGGLRFAHDKLREALLADLEPEERCTLHMRVAEAIERGREGTPGRLAALAFHFGEARDYDKEARYAALAGDEAVLHGAFPEAITLLERALALKTERAASPLEIARLHLAIGTATFFLMDFTKAMEHLARTCAVVGYPAPRTPVARAFTLVFDLLIQIALRLLPARLGVASRASRDALLEASRAAACLSNIAIFRNDEIGVVVYALRAANLAERAGHTQPLALAFFGFALGCMRLNALALRYFERMHMADAPAHELRNIATGTIAEASYLIGVGQLARADDVLRANLALCRRVGDRANAGYSEYLLALSAYYRGELDEARRHVVLAQDKVGDALNRHSASFATFEALLLCIDGHLDAARQRLALVKSLFTEHDRLAEAIWYGVLAMIEVRASDLDAARVATEAALSRVKTSRVVAASGAGLLGGAMETYLARWARAVAEGNDPASFAKPALRVLRFSRSWALVYPIGWPQTLLHEGEVEWLRGRVRHARKAWQKSLKIAQSLSLGLHQGLAHLALARASAAGSAARATHLAKARDRFSSAGATAYLEETEELLSREPRRDR